MCISLSSIITASHSAIYYTRYLGIIKKPANAHHAMPFKALLFPFPSFHRSSPFISSSHRNAGMFCMYHLTSLSCVSYSLLISGSKKLRFSFCFPFFTFISNNQNHMNTSFSFVPSLLYKRSTTARTTSPGSRPWW